MENNNSIEEAVLVDKVLIVEDAEVMARDLKMNEMLSDPIVIATVDHLSSLDEVANDPTELIYSGVEEVQLLGGILYVAVKHGSTIEVSAEPDTKIKIAITTEGVSGQTVCIFSAMYEEAKIFWEENVCQYLDIEVEPTDGYPGTQASRPGRVPPGYRKTRNVGSQSEVDCILKCIANTKNKNRSKNKAAKKSRAKNRK